MADEESKPSRKLPPLSPRSIPEGDDKPLKPIRKKKKKVPSEQGDDSIVEGSTETPKTTKTRSASRDRDSATKTSTDPETEPPTTPKKKKKKKTTDTKPSDLPDVTGSNASLIDKSNEGTPKKKAKKKKKVVKKVVQDQDEYADNGFTNDLTSIADDIIKSEEQKDDNELPYTSNVAALKSQPTQKIYVETIGGFKSKDKDKLVKRLAEQQAEREVVTEDHTQSTIELALSTYRVTKTFSLFIHGLTAGLALWQVVIVYVLASYGDEDFLTHYYTLALPVQCCSYLLLALCLVSACDRFDISSSNQRFWLRAVTLQNGAISILFYIVAVTLSLTIVSTEDRMHLYKKNSSLWEDKAFVATEMASWRNINAARGVFAILGWIVLSITPNADRLTKNLREGDEDDIILGKDNPTFQLSTA